MKFKINDIINSKKIGLAPMAGITDRAFREICSSFGASYFTSEMISVQGIIYDNEKTLSLLSHGNVDRPFAIQLFGNSPNLFSQAVSILNDKFYDIIDIIDVNMGCPAPKIVNNGSGSALMKNPKLCGEIVKSIKDVTDKPVTIKIRAGWDKHSINAVEVAKTCQENGVDAITIHGRTRSQMYTGQCDLDIIKKVKETTNVLIIGNGDITSKLSAKRMLEYTNCDMITIGRGALGRPWIFSEIINNINNTDISNIDKLNVITNHIEKICKYKGETHGIPEIRKHILWYLKGIRNSSAIKRQVCNIINKNELLNLLSKVYLAI